MWARAAVLGCAVLLSGAVSHASAGGLLPGATAMLGLLGVATVASARLLHGPASPTRLVVIVLSGQTLVHLALSGLAGHRGDTAPAAPTRPDPAAFRPTLDAHGHRVGSLADQWEAGQAHTAAVHDPALGLATALRHLVEHATSQAPAMLAAHLAGAVALGLWLATGERALWQLVHLAAARVQVRGLLDRALALWSSGPTAPAPVAAPTAATATQLPLLARRACRPVVRRGPPLALAV